jgi:hypothetical protein
MGTISEHMELVDESGVVRSKSLLRREYQSSVVATRVSSFSLYCKTVDIAYAYSGFFSIGVSFHSICAYALCDVNGKVHGYDLCPFCFFCSLQYVFYVERLRVCADEIEITKLKLSL